MRINSTPAHTGRSSTLPEGRASGDASTNACTNRMQGSTMVTVWITLRVSTLSMAIRSVAGVRFCGPQYTP